MAGETESTGQAADRIGAYRQAYRKERRRDHLAGLAAVGQIACTVGVVDAIVLLLRGRIGVGIGLAALSIALSVVLYFASVVATDLLTSHDGPDTE